MDSFTQIVLGAAIGEAVLGYKIGNRAPVYGAIAGTIPDLDVILTLFMDTSSALLFHRGISHSIVFAICSSLLISILLSRYESYKNKWGWFWLFFLSFLTHAILDAQTTWGTQLFWPFEYRLALDNIFIVDPFYTLPLAILLALAMRYPKNKRSRTILNNIGLVISTFYLASSLLIKVYVYEQFKSSLNDQGIKYQELNIRPSPMNIILWSANVKTQNSFLLGHYSVFDSQPITFEQYPKSISLPKEYINSNSLKRMIKFCEGWYVISYEEGNYYFNDLRSGTYSFNSENSEFVFKYKMYLGKDEGLIFLKEDTTPQSLSSLLGMIVLRIKGN